MFRFICSPKGRLAIGWLLLLFLFISCKKDIVSNKVENQETLSAPNLSLGNYWTQLTPPDITGPPSSDDYNFTFSLNNKVYVVVRGFNQLWEYDPVTTLWTKLQNNFYTFSSNDYLDVFTNGNSVYFLNPETKNLKEYNVSTNVWTDKASFPGSAKRVGTSCNTVTKGYVMGGTNGNHPGGYEVTLSQNWEYDFAANTWTQKTNTPGYSRFNSASFAVGDNIYFGTGISIIPKLNPVTFDIYWVPIINNDWHEYNTITNTWTQKAYFAGGTRQDTRGFVIGGKVYLGLGSAGYFTNLKSDLWSYNPASDSWTQRAGYPPGNPYPPFNTMLGANSRGYSVTGKIQSFWKYTPPFTIIPNPGPVQ
jgi:hypothetical protein